MPGTYFPFSFPHTRCVWQAYICSRMPSRTPYAAKWQHRVGPVPSVHADTLPRCGMVLNECRISHSLTPWSLFFHLFPTAVWHQIPPHISWIHYHFYSIRLLHTMVSVGSSSWCKLWWVLWNLGSSNLKKVVPMQCNSLNIWFSAPDVSQCINMCMCVFLNVIIVR